jgi:hypothetical protein
LKKEKRCQPKGYIIYSIKLITENFPNLEKVLPIQVQEASRTPNRLDQNRTSPRMLSLKQQAQGTEKDIDGCKRKNK